MADKWNVKWEHFWYYHKMQVLLVCFLLFLCLYTLGHIILWDKECVLYGEIINIEVASDELNRLCDSISVQMNLVENKEYIQMGTGTYINTENPEQNALNGSLENISLQIFSKSLDFMICTESVMEYYKNLDAFLCLDEFAVLYKEIEPGAYGISLDRDIFYGKTDTEPVYFCVLKNTQNYDRVCLLIELIHAGRI